MKKINVLLIALVAFALSSCARGCQSLERKTIDNHKHSIKISQYSGGKLIGEWTIRGIVSDAEGSDGYFFYDNNNKLIEISGDVRLEYLD